ncbi:hypothetical protein GCM10027589_18470 [Actinocorallia lasiicapitis]
MTHPDDDRTHRDVPPEATHLDVPVDATHMDAPAEVTRHEPRTFPSYGNAAVPPSADEEIRLRFGAGPSAVAPKVWTPTPRKRRRSRIAPLISIAISTAIIGGIAWYLLQTRGPLEIATVKVEAPSGVQRCDRATKSREVRLKAVVALNGKAGELSYRWTQSDAGGAQQLQTLRVVGGEKTKTIPLTWRVEGEGRASLTATFELLSPSVQRTAVTFRYSCT